MIAEVELLRLQDVNVTKEEKHLSVQRRDREHVFTPTFRVKSPEELNVIVEERPPQNQPPHRDANTTPSLRTSMPDASETKSSNPDATPWFPDFRIFRLPKAGNPLNYHLFMN